MTLRACVVFYIVFVGTLPSSMMHLFLHVAVVRQSRPTQYSQCTHQNNSIS